MTLADSELKEMVGFTSDLAEEAGRMALNYFGRVDGRLKEDRSWITDADLAVQELIFKGITREFPKHLILGEESTATPDDIDGDPDNPFVWIVDPIDGTDAFRAGFPVWGISIGLLEKSEPVLGVIHLPLLEETYRGARNNGAELNGQPIKVAPDKEVDDLSILLVPSDIHRRFQIEFPGKIRAMGSAAAHLAYVACGSAAGCLTEAYIWDLAGGLAILKAAGGAWRHIDGSPMDLRRHLNRDKIKPPIVISNPQLLDYWLEVITELE